MVNPTKPLASALVSVFLSSSRGIVYIAIEFFGGDEPIDSHEVLLPVDDGKPAFACA